MVLGGVTPAAAGSARFWQILRDVLEQAQECMGNEKPGSE